MEIFNYIMTSGFVTSAFVLLVLPLTKWFEQLNTFEATTTIEELLEDERNQA